MFGVISEVVLCYFVHSMLELVCDTTPPPRLHIHVLMIIIMRFMHN